jgi:hypothetical protein
MAPIVQAIQDFEAKIRYFKVTSILSAGEDSGEFAGMAPRDSLLPVWFDVLAHDRRTRRIGAFILEDPGVKMNNPGIQITR